MADSTGRKFPQGSYWAFGYALGLIAFGPLMAAATAIPVAVQVAQRKWANAAVVVAGTGVLAGMGVWFQKVGAPAAAQLGIIMAINAIFVGVPVGLSVVRHMRYSRGVAFATSLALLPVVGVMAFNWGEMATMTEHGHDEMAALLADEDKREGMSEREQAMLEWQVLLAKYWTYWVAGGAFSAVLIFVCIALSAAIGWLVRRGQLLAPPGSFRTLRPPDALVWVVIAAAALWFASERWAWEGGVPVFWNLAIALATIYGLNGLSIVLYGLDVWRPHPLVLAVLMVLAVVFNMLVFLPILGLFDTWGEFRRKIDTIVAARELGNDSPDDPM